MADQLVIQGWRRLPTYACAIVAGSALAAATYWVIHAWLPVPQSWPEQMISPGFITRRVFLEYLIWGAMGASIYAHHRAALQATDRLNAAQISAARSRRAAIESRLQALQARVDPQFLSCTLMQILETYDRDAAAGASLLDELITYLRASLARTQHSGLTVASELSRTQAYFGIAAPQLRFSVCAAPAALAARIPAMLLLPLAECVVPLAAARERRLQIDASVTGGVLCVTISSECAGGPASCSDDALQAVRRRLRDLYADRARLTATPQTETRLGLTMRVPYESS
jgi:LytS/YehU family sensor histidine kinase